MRQNGKRGCIMAVRVSSVGIQAYRMSPALMYVYRIVYSLRLILVDARLYPTTLTIMQERAPERRLLKEGS